MTKRVVILVVLMLSMMIAAGMVSGTTWGVRDGEGHPYVGLMIFDMNGAPAWRCTGTLMSPTVVLTAAHCVDGATGGRIWFESDIDANRESTNYPFSGGTGVEFAEMYAHPDYNASLFTNDLAVVILAEPVNLSTYGNLPTENLLANMPARERRNNFTVAGYGLQGYIAPVFSRELVRYRGDVSLIEVNSAFNAGVTAKFTNNPGQGNGSGGSCFGDSGGPVFLAGTSIVTAVVSWGITPCIGVDYQARTDVASARAFLGQFIVTP